MLRPALPGPTRQYSPAPWAALPSAPDSSPQCAELPCRARRGALSDEPDCTAWRAEFPAQPAKPLSPSYRAALPGSSVPSVGSVRVRI
ncbi:MAG: hypothetical protein ACI30I_03450 [Parabacteroides sp.]